MEIRTTGNWTKGLSYYIMANDWPAFCLCSKTLERGKLKGINSNVIEEMLRQNRI